MVTKHKQSQRKYVPIPATKTTNYLWHVTKKEIVLTYSQDKNLIFTVLFHLYQIRIRHIRLCFITFGNRRFRQPIGIYSLAKMNSWNWTPNYWSLTNPWSEIIVLKFHIWIFNCFAPKTICPRTSGLFFLFTQENRTAFFGAEKYFFVSRLLTPQILASLIVWQSKLGSWFYFESTFYILKTVLQDVCIFLYLHHH